MSKATPSNASRSKASPSTAASPGATLTITSKNYGAWSLRGWLLCKMAGLDFDVRTVESDDPSARAELLLLAPSFRVPCISIDGVEIWDTLAIGEYLHEIRPDTGILPADPVARAHCRSICGEMHSGFANLRSALPMNLRASFTNFKLFSGVQADIDRISSIWHECLSTYGGPFLFGKQPSMADAMYSPVCTRFRTYGVKLNETLDDYCTRILNLPAMQEWISAAEQEPDAIEELDVEF